MKPDVYADYIVQAHVALLQAQQAADNLAAKQHLLKGRWAANAAANAASQRLKTTSRRRHGDSDSQMQSLESVLGEDAAVEAVGSSVSSSPSGCTTAALPGCISEADAASALYIAALLQAQAETLLGKSDRAKQALKDAAGQLDAWPQAKALAQQLQ